MQTAVECAQLYMMMDGSLMSFTMYEIRDMTSLDRKKNAYQKALKRIRQYYLKKNYTRKSQELEYKDVKQNKVSIFKV